MSAHSAQQHLSSNGNSEVKNLREACGIFGIWADSVDVARLTFYGLFALQHRGQESAGICTVNNNELHISTGMGLVSQIFTEDKLEPLKGHGAIGHVRYSTTGASRIDNAQPLLFTDPQKGGQIAFAHNGNVVNTDELKIDLSQNGTSFDTTSDTEVLSKYLLEQKGEWRDRIKAVMEKIPAAYSFVMITPEGIIAARDRYGMRPLCIGSIDGGYVVASESCAFGLIGAEFMREITPGEMITIDNMGLRSEQILRPATSAHCIFEHIYLARPDSVLEGQTICESRERLGAQLAQEQPSDADIVIGVPDSATFHAIGYAKASGIPYYEALVKNRYVSRTFIAPEQSLRDIGAQLKYNPLRSVINGRRVVVVDDSIVRGTTTPRIVKLLRKAGASEIHFRVASPPIRRPCAFGIDMGRGESLIAAHSAIKEILDRIGADSLGYLSLRGMQHALKLNQPSCTACFDGNYPVPVPIKFENMSIIDHNDLAANRHSPMKPSNVKTSGRL